MAGAGSGGEGAPGLPYGNGDTYKELWQVLYEVQVSESAFSLYIYTAVSGMYTCISEQEDSRRPQQQLQVCMTLLVSKPRQRLFYCDRGGCTVCAQS